ncbi:DUF423 domain-containing protein [Sneathiella sp. P13V-1]|uniref:DUF423 domain-containing protein n=1 Tax=Sneathiella sp. P13V-1 TaxID=2697366 RepID=UPI00187B968B|nr:DUF423 domain-containing protein [Sneathiella sp. P13V-1]MBE7635354.1 DUF423 domain-containing protein [Sneathiella sp. P13V-1]
MRNPWLLIAALFGAAGVILGAVGSHIVAANGGDIARHEMAVSYQFYSIAGLIGCFVAQKYSLFFAKLAGLALSLGTLLFSGSLYYLSWTGEVLIPLVTPTGGVIMIGGWFFLVVAGFFACRSSN